MVKSLSAPLVQINSLTAKLRQVEKQHKPDSGICDPKSGRRITGRSVWDFAEKNKIGKKDRNNGVLLLIVKNDRKLRIEVGYGLEGALTDAASSSIIRNEITPKFKQGNYYDGINAGVDAIIAVTKGEYAGDKRDPKGWVPAAVFRFL